MRASLRRPFACLSKLYWHIQAQRVDPAELSGLSLVDLASGAK